MPEQTKNHLHNQFAFQKFVVMPKWHSQFKNQSHFLNSNTFCYPYQKLNLQYFIPFNSSERQEDKLK